MQGCQDAFSKALDRIDPEFFDESASKPVGNYMREEEAQRLKEEHPVYIIKKVKPIQGQAAGLLGSKRQA